MLWRMPVKGDNIQHTGSGNVVTVQADWGTHWFSSNKDKWVFVEVTPIEPPPPPPPPKSGWVNVYFSQNGTQGGYVGVVHNTLKEADKQAGFGRSACIYVEEGQFDGPDKE